MKHLKPAADQHTADGHSDPVDRVVEDWSRERPELRLQAMAIFGRLSRISVLQRAIFNARHEAVGLTLGSFDVLANLRRSGPDHQKTAGELASSSMLSTGGITMRLDRLEMEGLIERVRSDDDRRVVYARLTERGRDLIDAVYGDHVEAQEALLSDLDADELDQLGELLSKVERSISGHEAKVRDLPRPTTVP